MTGDLTETIDDNLQDQTDNIDNEDQDNSEIIQTDNNTLDFNSPVDFNDHRHNTIDNDPIETKDNIFPCCWQQ